MPPVVATVAPIHAQSARAQSEPPPVGMVARIPAPIAAPDLIIVHICSRF